ncbi:hypothetical protein [Shewanella sp. GXUN23E]|uniref:hypothetical protein n=1 Tax=Shewanella sp. GXUN23E TaxID=3422498 RepID=UPI003D7D948C
MRAGKAAIGLILAIGTQTAYGGDWRISVGGFYAESDSSIKVTDPIVGNDFKLDLETDLRLEESLLLPFFELSYSPSPGHLWYLDWKQLHRQGENQAITRPFEVNIKDTVYQVQAGAHLNTRLDIDIIRLGYGYDLYQADDYTLTATLGLHTMLIGTVLEGEIGACLAGELGNQQCGQTPIPRVVEHDVTAPLPDIGIAGRYQLWPGVELNGHFQYFYIKLSDLTGGLTDAKLGVSANIAKDWQISLAYNYYRVNVEVRDTVHDIKVADYNVRYSFTGPNLSVSYRF